MQKFGSESASQVSFMGVRQISTYGCTKKSSNSTGPWFEMLI